MMTSITIALSIVLKSISAEFKIDLSKAKLQNIEVGVNIQPAFSVEKVLSNLIIHNMQPFKSISVVKGDYRKAHHDRYNVKIYNKALQFGLQKQILRFELQFKKMADLKREGVEYLSDLLSLDKLKTLLNRLIKAWDEVILFDWTIKKENLSKTLRDKYYKWQIQNVWLDLNKNVRYKWKKI